MRNITVALLPLLLLGAAFSIHARAGEIGVGILTVDIPDSNGDANSYELDTYNLTDLNDSVGGCCTGAGLSDAFPIATQLLTDVSSLTVTAKDGTTTLETLGSLYFSLNADGQSLDGGSLFAGFTMASDTPGSATLTGTFSTTSVELDDGSMVTIDPNFSVTLADAAGLMEGDSVEIFANTVSSGVPEPGTWLMLGTGLLALVFLRGRRALPKVTGFALLGALCLAGLPAAQAVTTGPRLNTWTSPSSGVAGTTTVNVVGQGFPAGTNTSNTTLAFASTCGGTPVATAGASNVFVLLAAVGEDRVGVLIPSALSTTGNYFITVIVNGVPSVNCSEVTVTVPVTVSGSCLPSSSLGVSINPTTAAVTAYVPNGAWGHGPSGLEVVQLEPTVGLPSSIATPGTVNSCASTPGTATYPIGQAVCVANDTDVYVLSGATPATDVITNTLTSGSDGTDGFSGGSCNNCGVAAFGNQAVVEMGLSGFAGGYQFLNLGATPGFVNATPYGVANEPSENIVWDGGRGLILSPNEASNYDLIQVGTGATSIAEFGRTGWNTGGEPDSAGEDCATGIALSTDEFTGNMFLTDLTQATFTPGTPGSWTAPGAIFTPSPNWDDYLGAGTSGMAVAPGSHLAVVAGEFGGDYFGLLSLPATSGSGTPTPVDYLLAELPTIPPGGCSFEAGYDPHTVTAYTSPNTGKALAVMANGDGVEPTALALVDMAGLLAATRDLGAHQISSTNTAPFVTWVAVNGGCPSSELPSTKSDSQSVPLNQPIH